MLPRSIVSAARWTGETTEVTKVVIDAIDRGSPAERAGLKAGDRVLEISGQRLEGMQLPQLRKLTSVQLTSGKVGTQELRVRCGLLRKELRMVVELKEPEPAKR
jgi:C-terminal processing protease CtpA/Prc